MNCLHPVRIKNLYNGQYMFVPCGKCDGCVITHANIMSRRISNELLKHSYNLFFTLTYDNEHLPFIKRNDDGVVDCVYNICSIVPYSYVVKGWNLYGEYEIRQVHRNCVASRKEKLDYFFDELPNYQPENHYLNNIVGVLCKEHMQKFIRSLRDYLYHYYGTRQKIIYYVVGEYGSKKHRPHYHGIIHLDSWEMFDHVKKFIFANWLYCSKERIHVKQLNGEKFDYLSSYVAGQRHSNGIFSVSEFKEFSSFSKQPLYGVHSKEIEILRDVESGRDYSMFRVIDGEKPNDTSVVSLQKSVLRSYFPRIRGVDYMDDTSLFSIIRNDDASFEDRHRLVLAFRRFMKKFYGVEKENLQNCHIDIYICSYRRIYSLLNGFLCQRVNEEIFKKVDIESIIDFYLYNYNTWQTKDVDIYSNQEYIKILHYIHQFDIHLSSQIYLYFMSETSQLLPRDYYKNVENYIYRNRRKLAPKHTSHILNNF